MYNSNSYGNQSQEDVAGQESHTAQQPSTNRYIYVQKRFHDSSKVLINPHFGKGKVFINPNFAGRPADPAATLSGPAIHVNPRMATGLVPCTNHTTNSAICSAEAENKTLRNTTIYVNPNVKQTVHINPNFTAAKTTSQTLKVVETNNEIKENIPQSDEKLNRLVVLTKTKLIRSMLDSSKGEKLKKRRNSIKSKYKIVKSGLSPKKKSSAIIQNRFKIDNRKTTTTHQKKYVYVNKLVSTSDLIKTRVFKGNSASKPLRNLSVVNINGIVYRKSRNSLRRALAVQEKTVLQQGPPSNSKIKPKTTILKKKFKIINRKNASKKKTETKLSPKKLKKCNIPCPYYRKYGVCKGKDNGKCFWKHDPDQIALCTRFLQGACLKDKCLLSHNVSPEKMPTCKYYLEGSCSRETCPYLHVKISPKAEVCRDFLEGFCRKAAECDKRHQYLCPDYEKYGKCVKQRCPYPHGKMVRTYLINNNKFAKKCSANKKRVVNLPSKSSETNEQTKEMQRYYAGREPKSDSEEAAVQLSEETKIVGFLSRPKLGSLPSFIPFSES